MRKEATLVICLFVSFCSKTSGDGHSISDQEERLSEVDKDDLILLNVAAKGRVVELLANELARTEIIRALLVEYARECARNVSVLEKHCIDCMMERCSNRFLECGIESPPLSEIITHQTSPIKGLEFLSKPPTTVNDHMNRFVKIARPDILRDVPDRLMDVSRRIVEEEVDQSLKDLNDNRDTDRALHALNIHRHDHSDVRTEPKTHGVVVVISHRDRSRNVAEFLSKKLRDSRPLFEKLGNHGADAIQEMPAVMEELGARLDDFKEKIGGVFSNILDGFQESMDQPNTAVVNGNNEQFSLNQRFQQVANAFNGIQQGQMAPNAPNQMFPGQGSFNQGQFNNQPFIGQQQFQQNTLVNPSAVSPNQMPPMNVQVQSLGSQGGTQTQFLQQQNAIFANPTLQSMVGAQGLPSRVQGQMFMGQGQTNGQSFQNIPQDQWQPQGQSQNSNFQGQPQGQNFPNPTQSQSFQGQSQSSQFQGQNVQGQSQVQGVQGQFQGQNFPNQPQGQNFQPQNIQVQPQNTQFQGQGQAQGRRKREVVACAKLKTDPDTYCRKFESQCHNCTLEKRLRFEVCGDGVERARDEIKRLDNSVDMYLETFETFIVGNRLILKIELNDHKRLHKTNTYTDAFITAKIGQSILRFQSSMKLNINNIRVSGSQIGDELWEKLWATGVFKEAEKVIIPPRGNDIMGQTHNQKPNSQNTVGVNAANQKTSPHTSAGSEKVLSIVTFTLSVIASFAVFLF